MFRYSDFSIASFFTMSASAALAAALLLTQPALAEQPLVTDDTGTQGQGGHQIELSYAHSRETLSAAAGMTVKRDIPLVLTTGFSDALDIYVAATEQQILIGGAATNSRERGLGNIAIGAKWRFHENKDSGLSLGFKPEVRLPVSQGHETRGLGTGRTSYGATFIATQETGFGELHFNLALGRVNYSDQVIKDAVRSEQYRVSLAPVWGVSKKFKLALDLGVMTNEDRAQNKTMGYVELGAVYSPTDKIDLALGVIRTTKTTPAASDAKTTQALLGLTWRFK